MQMKIYHTNDIHANYHFLKNVKNYLKEHMKENDIYLDSGDFYDLKDLIIQADKGLSAADLFTDIPLAAMAIGNGEVDLSYDALCKLAEKLPLLSINLTDNDGHKLPNIKSSMIIERSGKRFLIIGLSPFYNAKLVDSGYNVFSMMGNLMFNKPEELLAAEFNKLEGQYDYSIILSHSGQKCDGYVFRELRKPDLILGGHSHETVSQKGYSQSGKGEYLGIITLEIDDNGISEVSSEQIKLNDFLDEDFDRLLEEKERYAQKLLSKEIETIDNLQFDPLRESELTNFICDCLRKKFGGDLAIIHAGISENALIKPVSRKSLIENFPSKLNPTCYSIKGSRILEAAKLSFDGKHIIDPGKGPGFRGRILGTLGFSSNVKIKKDPFIMTIDDKPIESEKDYLLITDDYLQRGTGYPSLAVPNEKASYHIWFIRDLVEHFLDDEELFSSARIRRITD